MNLFAEAKLAGEILASEFSDPDTALIAVISDGDSIKVESHTMEEFCGIGVESVEVMQ